MASETTKLFPYTGSCHCEQVTYTAKLSSPIEEQVVNTCNCTKPQLPNINGYILVYVQKDNVTFNAADGVIKEYRFGTMKFPHGFCSNCGTSVYARADGGEYEGIVAVNGRTLRNVDISTLRIEELDGKKINVG